MNKKYNLTIPLEFDSERWKPQELMHVIYNRIVGKSSNEIPDDCEITFTDEVSFKIYKPKIEKVQMNHEQWCHQKIKALEVIAAYINREMPELIAYTIDRLIKSKKYDNNIFLDLDI